MHEVADGYNITDEHRELLLDWVDAIAGHTQGPFYAYVVAHHVCAMLTFPGHSDLELSIQKLKDVLDGKKGFSNPHYTVIVSINRLSNLITRLEAFKNRKG